MERNKGYYVVKLYGGMMGIIRATSLKNAKNLAIKEQGTMNVASICKAKEEDINWVKAMGGHIP